VYAITYKRCYPVHSTNITNPQNETIYQGTNSSDRIISNILLFCNRNTINLIYKIMFTYRNKDVYKANANTTGIKYYCRTSTGVKLQADTITGIKELINRRLEAVIDYGVQF